jgi:hypothetical protein
MCWPKSLPSMPRRPQRRKKGTVKPAGLEIRRKNLIQLQNWRCKALGRAQKARKELENEVIDPLVSSYNNATSSPGQCTILCRQNCGIEN